MITKSKKRHTGDMKQRCTVNRFTTSSDGGLGETESSSTLTEIWANITPMSAKRRLEFGQLNSTITHEIMTWYNDQVDEEDTITYDGRDFTLKTKINDGEESVYTIFAAAEES